MLDRSTRLVTPVPQLIHGQGHNGTPTSVFSMRDHPIHALQFS